MAAFNVGKRRMGKRNGRGKLEALLSTRSTTLRIAVYRPAELVARDFFFHQTMYRTSTCSSLRIEKGRIGRCN